MLSMSSDRKVAVNEIVGVGLEFKELLQVMTRLHKVETETPEVQKKANMTSMSDNNGKRIIYMLTKDMPQD